MSASCLPWQSSAGASCFESPCSHNSLRVARQCVQHPFRLVQRSRSPTFSENPLPIQGNRQSLSHRAGSEKLLPETGLQDVARGDLQHKLTCLHVSVLIAGDTVLVFVVCSQTLQILRLGLTRSFRRRTQTYKGHMQRQVFACFK